MPRGSAAKISKVCSAQRSQRLAAKAAEKRQEQKLALAKAELARAKEEAKNKPDIFSLPKLPF